MTGRAFIAALVLVGAAVAAIAQGPQGRGQGAPGARPGAGREPEFPVPNIREYKPESTLVVPQHPVARAKFPAIDFHGHPPQLLSADAIGAVVKSLDALNVKTMIVNGNRLQGEELRRWIDAVAATPYRDRFAFFANVNFGQSVAPGFGRAAAQQLEADVKAGAKGIAEIAKGFGINVRKADGSRLTLDDPELDPLWEAAARLDVPVFIHTADPQKFWDPIDYSNERWLELALFRDRRYQDPAFPRFETLMGERDRLFRKHKNTKFVTAHLGWHANDLARLGRMFDEMPNLYSEIGAVLYDIGRQPRFAREFFVKYKDRLLFGKDNYQPDEYPYYWRVLETNDEYFDYYRDRVSIEEIASNLRVRPDLIEAFERNDLSGWPRGLYARAWIRAYALAVDLDPVDTVEEFCRLFPEGDRRTGGTIQEIAAIVASPSEYRDEFSHPHGRRSTDPEPAEERRPVWHAFVTQPGRALWQRLRGVEIDFRGRRAPRTASLAGPNRRP